MYKKKEKKPTKIIVVPHFIGTEKDTKIFKKISLQFFLIFHKLFSINF